MALSTCFCTFFAKINIQKYQVVDLVHISCADLERPTGLVKVDSQLLKKKKKDNVKRNHSNFYPSLQKELARNLARLALSAAAFPRCNK